jgi:iron complex outermembrane receptor protein
VEGDTKTFGEKDQYRASLKLTWDVTPSTTLTAITGYVSAEIESAYDCDGTRVQACTVRPYEFDLWQVSEELTLAADLTERLDLIFGGLYLHTDYAQLTEFYSTAYIGLPPDILVVEALQTLNSYAVYGQLRYRVADDWRFSVGARYTFDEKTYEEDAKAVVVLNAGDFDHSWDAFTPRFAVDYTPTEELTLFASISRGFKAGGYNTYQVPQEAFNPEYVWSYEIGAKALLIGGRLRTAGSAFFMDYTDLQQNVYGFEPGSFTPQTINAGESEIFGVELEAEGFVTEQFRLGLTATWLDAVFTKLRTADPIFPELGQPDPNTGLNVRDLSGNRLSRAPKWQFTVSGEYSAPLTEDLVGVLRADYSTRGDHFFTLYNYDLEEQESYGLLNLYAAIESSDGRWTLSGYLRNALDERYVLNRQHQTAGIAPVPMNRAVFGEPRTYGMTLAYDF